MMFGRLGGFNVRLYGNSSQSYKSVTVKCNRMEQNTDIHCCPQEVS